MWQKNSNFQNKELEKYESKLNSSSVDTPINDDYFNKWHFRKSMLKVCNARLNIKYTISGTKDMIKMFLYYVNNASFYMLCKDWKDLSRALKIHKQLCACPNKDSLKRLIKFNEDFIKF